MKKLDQQYKERIRNAELFLQLETDQVEKNYVKEKKAAAKEFEDKKIELKENLIAELEEKKKMIENEKLTMELTGGKNGLFKFLQCGIKTVEKCHNIDLTIGTGF
ncbi:hypothetical protein CIB84_009249 [Bambusicola thoracicus]|uniref:Uncharacterized protein n=1 Tax=Bambusicola thoracicus TaxID=9083 RepID=A0A2P4SSB6_BAMTH|nr:hypothetical protein CIB84_009249 [Bambusicola thoracicus]